MVSEAGEQIGIVPTSEALQMAQEAGLDLVEVAPSARPPVCRIMDYGKYRYQMRKRARQSKGHTAEMKVLWLSPKTDPHDLDIKIRTARRFLEKRNRVQIDMRFIGRQRAHPELGEEALKRVAAQLSDIAKVERQPVLEGSHMTLILNPK